MNEQPRKSRFEVIRPLAAGIPGVAIGICILIITAILAVAPHDLDRLLRSALLFFALALPLYGLILMLLILERPMWQSYFILILASAFLWIGIFPVLDHLDGAAARAFGVATIAGVAVFTLNMVQQVSQVRRQRQLREARLSKAHSEQTTP